MQIGVPQRTFIADPLEDPVPHLPHYDDPDSDPTPVYEPEQEPAIPVEP